jgi:hypothetical protein
MWHDPHSERTDREVVTVHTRHSAAYVRIIFDYSTAVGANGNQSEKEDDQARRATQAAGDR